MKAKRAIVPTLLATMLVCHQSNAATVPAKPATCDGLPRLTVPTAPGFCLGLVAEGLKAPRAVLYLPNGDLIVADMGGWQERRGRIWLLHQVAGHREKSILFDQLDRPSSLALAPDGSVFVGMVKRVARFDPNVARPALTDVIGGTSGVSGLPGVGRHLLPSLLFDRSGDLFINIGSGSDHCETEDGSAAAQAHCAEREGGNALGVIRRYTLDWPHGRVRSWEIYARGLRNSMAMAFDPRSGILWQGENGRDSINAAMPELKNDDELPHDELNVVERGGDYGWPYCYDVNRSSPEYPGADCSPYRAPRRLLPAHAAPLGMTFYTGAVFPSKFKGSLIVSYHGYRRHGHRVVALLADRNGAPLGQSVDLVIGSRGNARGFGAPVGVSMGDDGRVYMTDDHDGMVARLSYEGQVNER